MLWKLYVQNKWRFSPKQNKERKRIRAVQSQRIRAVQSRKAAIARKERQWDYKNKKIWAKTFKDALEKYNKLSAKDRNRLTEIF